MLLDPSGIDIGSRARMDLERIVNRQDIRRPAISEMGVASAPLSVLDDYITSVMNATDLRGVSEAGLRIVDHARADHGADGLAGDHAAAVEGVGAAQLRHRDYVPRAHHPYLSIASLLLPNARDAAYAGAPTANPTYPTQVRRA